MSEKAGTLSSGLIWLFALAAILLGIAGGYLTASLGAKISSAVYFGIFAVAGFLGAYLTSAGKGASIVAFIVAAVVSAVVYYFITAAVVASATETMAAAAGGNALASKAAGGFLGSVMGIFTGVITLIVSMIAGISGCLFGARGKRKALAMAH
jgi:hypothetical protein